MRQNHLQSKHELLFASEISIEFVCSYSLEHQTISTSSVVTGVDINLARQARGHLNYRIDFKSDQIIIGDRLSFDIVPTTPGAVYSRVTSCQVMNHDKSKIYKLIYEQDGNSCTDWLLGFSLDTDSWSSSETQTFRFIQLNTP